jgi:3-hydroxyisobutyrate dehydrogenase-like beta-hydroxyacid dehydrogenase
MNGIRVGMIGVGNMGGAMARRLLKLGVNVTVFDRNGAVQKALEECGASVAASPREIADQCSIVIACLSSPEASIDVALGDLGVVGGKAVEVYIETSTVGRPTIELIAEGLKAKNIGFVDCPISGGIRRAETGGLALMISGAEAHVAKAAAVLELLGENRFYLHASPGVSQVAKLINNHISTTSRVAVFEGLAMGVKAGIDIKVLNDVLNAGTARNDTTINKVPAAILSGTFKYGGPLTIGLKDEALMIEEAKRYNAALWLAPRVLELYREAAAAGYADQDGMRLFTYVQSVDGAKQTAEGTDLDC